MNNLEEISLINFGCIVKFIQPNGRAGGVGIYFNKLTGRLTVQDPTCVIFRDINIIIAKRLFTRICLGVSFAIWERRSALFRKMVEVSVTIPTLSTRPPSSYTHLESPGKIINFTSRVFFGAKATCRIFIWSVVVRVTQGTLKKIWRQKLI